MACELFCCLLPQCEALRICRSRFPIATLLSVIASIKWYLACFKFLETTKDGLLLLSDILLCVVYCSKGYFLETVIILPLHMWETTIQHVFGSHRNVAGFAITYSETDSVKFNDASVYRNIIFLWLKTKTL